MGDVLNFKCPCCGAKLVWKGSSGQMTCEYCDAEFTMEQVKASEAAQSETGSGNDMTWSSSESALITDEDGKVQGYLCPSCGAEMVANDNTAATECPYCGNQAIIPKSFEGMYRPDVVLPFAVDKDAAKGKLSEFVKGKKLLPDSFTKNNRIDSITGLYVPFWLYTCHAGGSVEFSGEKIKRWEDSRFEYEKVDTYRVLRSGEMDFERIPADASTQMDDATMDSLEPYDLSKAVAYDAAYFSGYLADRYDVEEKDARPRADERVINTFRDKMKEKTSEYDTVNHKSESIKLTNAKAEYAMLPVWMMTTEFEGKKYTFGINGQTGKMVGSLPIDKGKYYKYLIISSLISLVITEILSAIFFGDGIGAFIAFILAIVIGFLYAGSLKSAMNTIAVKTTAASYLNENSLKYGRAEDDFLYSKTNKTPKPDQNS